MSERGRHAYYDPANNPKVAEWAQAGLTLAQIAKNLDVSPRSVNYWAVKYPDFAAAMKVGRDVANREVVGSLFKRANGYTYDEVTRERMPIVDKETGEVTYGLVETKRVTKEVAADTTAMIFWLCNRMKEEWCHVNRVEFTGADGGPIEMRNMNPEERKARIHELIAKRGDGTTDTSGGRGPG